MICAICLDEIKSNNESPVWKCGHLFHTECLSLWEGSCPYCRCNNLTEDNDQDNKCNRNIWDKNEVKKLRQVPEHSKNIYLNLWKDRNCINNSHRFICAQPYGVLLICEDCNSIQTFNLKH